MKVQGAVLEEEGIKFAVFKVEKDIFEVPGRARDKMISIQRQFPDMAVIFMSKEPGKAPSFFGRPDIIRIMTAANMDDVEWKEYILDEPEIEN
jgi:hypothetical protein